MNRVAEYFDMWDPREWKCEIKPASGPLPVIDWDEVPDEPVVVFCPHCLVEFWPSKMDHWLMEDPDLAYIYHCTKCGYEEDL